MIDDDFFFKQYERAVERIHLSDFDNISECLEYDSILIREALGQVTGETVNGFKPLLASLDSSQMDELKEKIISVMAIKELVRVSKEMRLY